MKKIKVSRSLRLVYPWESGVIVFASRQLKRAATLSCYSCSVILWPLALQKCGQRCILLALELRLAAMALAAMPPIDSNWKDVFSDSEDEKETGAWLCYFHPNMLLSDVVLDLTSSSKLPLVHLTNRFVDALMDAARQYSEETQESRLPTVIEPNVGSTDGIVGEIEDVGDELFSDSDEGSDRPAKATSLDSTDTMSYFYKPVGDWAALASQPIENTRVVKTLHGTPPS